MAIEDILEALDEQCRQECREIFDRAQEEAKRIIAKAQEEAEALRRQRLDRIRAEAESEATSILYSARLKAKNELIRAREEVASRALELAEERLKDLRSRDDYPDILKGYLEEALSQFEGKVVIHVDPRDKDLVSRLMKKTGIKHELRTDLETAGGVVVSNEGEDVRVLNTVEERLRRARERLRIPVYRLLFGEEV
ncbi:MAG: V-type ATP synthase subunit E [Candidatus Geothermincolales bacterium]